MKKQLGWALKLGGAESLGISKAGVCVSQVDGVSDVHQLASSVEGGFRQGTMASACPDARHFSFSLYNNGAFQAATLVLELRGSQSVYGFFKSKCLGLQQFLPPTQLLLVFAARSCRDLPSWHRNPGLGCLAWGWDSSLPRYPF